MILEPIFILFSGKYRICLNNNGNYRDFTGCPAGVNNCNLETDIYDQASNAIAQ